MLLVTFLEQETAYFIIYFIFSSLRNTAFKGFPENASEGTPKTRFKESKDCDVLCSSQSLQCSVCVSKEWEVIDAIMKCVYVDFAHVIRVNVH